MRKFVLAFLLPFLFAGCVSVPMESAQQSELAKQFNPPSHGKAGLYIYRSGPFGPLERRDVWVDGKCIGASAPNTFFYEEIQGDSTHGISSQLEPSHLSKMAHFSFYAISGENYFVRQYIPPNAPTPACWEVLLMSR